VGGLWAVLGLAAAPVRVTPARGGNLPGLKKDDEELFP
jgi:hypothetical protein